MTRLFLLFIFLCCISASLFAQNLVGSKDCDTAPLLCNNDVIIEKLIGPRGNRGFNDVPNSFISCFRPKTEYNPFWYKFTAENSGTFEMFLNAKQEGVDFDFIIFDITAGCASKSVITCNSSQTDQDWNYIGTGISNDSAAFYETDFPDEANSWEPTIGLVSGRSYAIYIESRSLFPTDSSFTITFGGSAIFRNINAQFTVPLTNCLGKAVAFTNTSTGSGTLNYKWDFGDGTALSTATNPSHLYTSAGNYKVKLTTSNGYCSDQDSLMVNISVGFSPAAGLDATICAGNAANLLATGGVNYNWSPGIGLSSTTIPNPVASPTSSTTYFLTATDVNGCIGYDTLRVTVNPLPVANAGADFSLCLGLQQAMNGSGGINYSWSPTSGLSNPAVANPMAAPLATTTYTLTVSDNNNCSATDNVVVTINPLPIAAAGPDVAICSGSSTTLNASGGNTYTWSPSLGLSSTNIANPTAAPTATTMYKVTVSNVNLCTQKDSVTVTVNPLPTVDAGSNISICSGGATVLSATGGTSFFWTPSVGLSATNIGNPTATPSSTTTYTVTASDANNCSNSDLVTVTVNPLPTVNAGSDVTICEGSTTLLQTTGAGTILWSPAAGLSSATISRPIATPSITTNYTVTVTDGNSCSSSDNVLVTVNSRPVANAGPDVTICTGNSAQLNASGGSTYLWSPALGLSNTAIANPTAQPTTTTNYSVVITGANGCSNTDVVTVAVAPLPVANAGAEATICAGASTSLVATGGATYSWSPSTGLSNPAIANPIASPTTTITYTVVVKDVIGCEGQDQVNVTVIPAPLVDAGADIFFCEGSTALLAGSGSGTLLWSPAINLSNPNIATPVASPSVTTSYTLTASDPSGCQSTDEVLVTVNSLPTPNAGNDVTICRGTSTQLAATGGLTYQWISSLGLSNPSISNPLASPLLTTTYEVEVTGANGCKASDEVTVTVNFLPNINAGNDTSICNGNAASLQAKGGVNYVWIPASTLSNNSIANPLASPSKTTTYYVNVSDAAGCSGLDSVVVSVNYIVVKAFSDTTLCEGASKKLNATGGIVYRWSPSIGLSDPNAADPMAQPLVTTRYIANIEDANGCKNQDTVTIQVKALPLINAGNDVVFCEGDSTQLNATGGNTYLWTPSIGLSNTNTPDPLAIPSITTTYFVTGKGTNGCENSDDVTVSVNPIPLANAGRDTTFCAGNSTLLQASGGATYQWTPALGLSNPAISSPTATPVAPINYVVSVTNSFGCKDTDTVYVNVTYITIEVSNDTSLCLGQKAQLHANGGSSVIWSPSLGLSNPMNKITDAKPDKSTAYLVTVTDTNGCKNSDSVLVTINYLTTTISPDTAVCYGESVDLEVKGGATQFWAPAAGLSNPAAGKQTITPLNDVEYVVTSTDVFGCSNKDTIAIIVKPLPIASAGQDTVLCNGKSVVLNGSGNGAYQWSPQLSLSNSTIANPQASPTVTTTYKLTVLGSNQCTKQDSVIVSVSYINITKSNDTTVCTGNSVQINASGGSLYRWVPSTGLSDASVRNPVASPIDTTVYTITVTDTNGCKNSGEVQINVNAFPIANAGADITICQGRPAQLSATGGSSYKWSPGATLSNAAIANPLATPVSNTQYIVAVADNIGCTTQDTIQVSLVFTVNGTASATPDKFCSGQPVQVVAKSGTGVVLPTNPYSYDGGYTFVEADTFKIPHVNSDTTIHVIIKDAAGCLSDSIKVEVAQFEMKGNLEIIAPAACSGSVSGVAFWITPPGEIAPSLFVLDGKPKVSDKFDSLAAGNHVLMVYNKWGCAYREDFVIPIASGFSSQAIKTDLTCFTENLGSISVATSGGSGNGFSYSISNNTFQAANLFDSLSAGTYTIVVRDSALCYDTIRNILITAPAELLLMSSFENITCKGEANGKITLSAEGGMPGYKYSIDSKVFLPQASYDNLPAGAYTASVEDENGCKSEFSILLKEPLDTLSAFMEVTQLPACGGVKGVITLSNVKGGNPGAYWRTINNGPRRLTNEFTDLLPGTHIIRIIDAKECFNDFTTIIPADSNSIQPPIVKLDSVVCHGTASGGVYLSSLTGGTRPYLLSLNDELNYQTDSTFLKLKSGNYQVYAKNSNGCVSIISVTIPQPDSLMGVIASTSDITCYSATDGAISVRAIGGNPEFLFALNGNKFGPSGTFTNLSSGLDTIKIKDAKGCQAYMPFTMVRPDSILLKVASLLPATCSAKDGEAKIMVASGGSGSLKFSLNDGITYQTDSILGLLGSGSYSLIAKDAAGCTAKASFSINQKGGGILIDSIRNDISHISCNNANEGRVRLYNIQGGKGPYLYTIDTISTKVSDPTFDGLSAGAHVIHITDGAGCKYEITLTVAQPTQINFDLSIIKKVSCNEANGIISVHNVLGGKGNYVYSIDGKSYQDSARFVQTGAGIHTIEVKDGTLGACTTTKSITMEGKPAPDATITIHNPLCFGSQDGFITIDTVTGGLPPYEFSLNESQFSSTSTIGLLSADTFRLKIKDSECPAIVDLQPTIVYEKDGTIKDTVYLPYFNLSQPDSISAETFSVDADRNIRGGIFGIYNVSGGTAPYYFSLNDSTFSPVLKDTILVEGVTPGDYFVYLQDSRKCPQKIKIYLGRTFFIPNLFTPNGDGKNELFEIMALQNNSSLVIYNRWGSRMYSNDDYDNSWNGEGLPDGLYYYELQVTKGKKYKGWVEIVR